MKSDLRSILWQLKQYQKDNRPLFIDADELLRGGKGKFADQKNQWIDVLYSVDYYLFYKSGLYGERRSEDVERDCNSCIVPFLKKEDYVSKFRACLTPRVRRLILLNALVATFSLKHGIDKVAKNHRSEICKKLKIAEDVSRDHAMGVLLKCSSDSTIEERILGRIGYLILWKDVGEPPSE